MTREIEPRGLLFHGHKLAAGILGNVGKLECRYRSSRRFLSAHREKVELTVHIFARGIVHAVNDGVRYAQELASLAAGLGTVENSQWFFLGKLEAQQVTPNLTDSNTATVTITLQSRFFGAFTQT